MPKLPAQSASVCFVDDRSTFISRVMQKIIVDALYCDVVLVVDGHEYRAHRAILAAQSATFAAMFDQGGSGASSKNSSPNLSSSNNVISQQQRQPARIELQPQLKNSVFNKFLEYFYSAAIDVANLKEGIDLFVLANDFKVEPLIKQLASSLCDEIDESSVFDIIEVAVRFKHDFIVKKCLALIATDGAAYLKKKKLTALPQSTLSVLLASDAISAEEVDVLAAIQRWHCANADADVGDLLDKVRFELVSLKSLSLAEFSNIYKFLCANGIENLESKYSDLKDARLRLEPVGSMAGATLCYEVSAGEKTEPIFSRLDSAGCLGLEQMPTSGRVVVKLEKNCYVESMALHVGDYEKPMQPSRFRFWPWSKPAASESDCIYPTGFKVATSVDGKSWSNLVLQTWQGDYSGRVRLIFDPRIVRYIQIVGNPLPGSQFVIKQLKCPEKITYGEKLMFSTATVDNSIKGSVLVDSLSSGFEIFNL